MSKQLQKRIDNIRKHLAVGNKDSAQKLADFLVRSAPTDAARKKAIDALRSL
jgi:hypothetical protein